MRVFSFVEVPMVFITMLGPLRKLPGLNLHTDSFCIVSSVVLCLLTDQNQIRVQSVYYYIFLSFNKSHCKYLSFYQVDYFLLFSYILYFWLKNYLMIYSFIYRFLSSLLFLIDFQTWAARVRRQLALINQCDGR